MMTITEAQRRLSALIARSGGTGPHLVGVLVADENGDLAVSMDSNDEADILMLGVNARRRSGPVVVDQELGNVTATLETVDD